MAVTPTTDELIEIISKPVHDMRFQGRFCTNEIIIEVLTAIEAAGLCIVPREATEVMIENGGSAHIYPSVYMGGVPERAKIHANSIYRTMIAAGKL